MKRIALLTVALLALSTFSCRRAPEHARHTEVLTGYFDTLINLVAYTKTQDEFDQLFQLAEKEFLRLHRLFDIYNNYQGLNNIKTVNDGAGIEPVIVPPDLLALVRWARDWTLARSGKTNIALGPVLKIWHDYRTQGYDDPENAQLPPRDLLVEAARLTDPSQIVIDEAAGTIYLAVKGMSLDVGAVAKGYATELVARTLEEAGLSSGVISTGGNVRVIGKPLDGLRDRWGIGIFDPKSPIFAEERNLDVVYVNDASVVSSGDYQRYYYVEGVRYHHLIDPDTLWPANYYRALTVVTADSGQADLLSTELYLLPYEESRALADSLEGVEVLWIMPGGEIRYTRGMADILQSQGASGKD